MTLVCNGTSGCAVEPHAAIKSTASIIEGVLIGIESCRIFCRPILRANTCSIVSNNYDV